MEPEDAMDMVAQSLQNQNVPTKLGNVGMAEMPMPQRQQMGINPEESMDFSN